MKRGPLITVSGTQVADAISFEDGDPALSGGAITLTSGVLHSAVGAPLTVTGSDTLVMYTYGGDANLDGKINVDDYGRIDFNAPLGTSGWFNGDFNYDGKINVDDYGIIDFNVGIQGPPFPTGSDVGSLTAVPEPGLAGLMLLGGASMTLGSRRRRRAGHNNVIFG